MLNLKKLPALSCQEWAYLSAALVFLPLLRFSLKLFSFQSVLSFLAKTSPIPSVIPTSLLAYPHNSVGDPEIASLVRMIDLAAIRGPVKANCLPRSLAIWWLLRRRGLQPDLRLGVRPQNNGIQAHAWVEYKGRVLNDEPGIGLHFAAFEKLRSEQGRKET